MGTPGHRWALEGAHCNSGKKASKWQDNIPNAAILGYDVRTSPPRHRLHPLKPQGHPGPEPIRDSAELRSLPGLWKSTTVSWTPTLPGLPLCSQKSLS